MSTYAEFGDTEMFDILAQGQLWASWNNLLKGQVICYFHVHSFFALAFFFFFLLTDWQKIETLFQSVWKCSDKDLTGHYTVEIK